ncbi:cell envelope integrity protein TolA [Rhizobium sp. C4]|uniref:cell envelope integrity protein TolA n=1 Tax=Rhizobium sp. C4 TaxID=1349800 RepID=UPI001E522EC0|nr:energy transducer TonB [Rhizobium sp. C4]MCD2172092.1 TonB family protein [Rhizobium sp. C4]
MTDLHIDSKIRRSGMLPGAGELQRRKELRNGRRTFRSWPLLPVPALLPTAGPQLGPSVDWPPGQTVQGEDDWQDRPDERDLGRDFAPLCEASLSAESIEQPQAAAQSRALKTCLLASVALHLCCAVFLMSMPAPETVEIAGGGAVSVMLVGEQAFDSLAAGTADGEAMTQPVEQAKVVETADQPVEATATEQSVEPVEAEKAMSEPVTETAQATASVPTEPTDATPPPEQMAQAVPETQGDVPPVETAPTAENFALDPTAVSENGELQPAPEVAVLEPQAQQPVSEPPSEPLKAAEPKAQPEKKRVEKKAPSPKKVEKPNADEKKAAARKQADTEREAKAAPAKNRKGEAGEGTANAQRGASATADSAARSDPGNAAMSNYPGKVAAKLRRALKYPKSAVSSSSGEAQVAFTVLADGSATGIRVVSSSGSPVLDQAAVEAVRRASPFPPIPAEAGRRQWPFAVPVLFRR